MCMVTFHHSGPAQVAVFCLIPSSIRKQLTLHVYKLSNKAKKAFILKKINIVQSIIVTHFDIFRTKKNTKDYFYFVLTVDKEVHVPLFHFDV